MNQTSFFTSGFKYSIFASEEYRKEKPEACNLTVSAATFSIRAYPIGLGVYSLQELKVNVKTKKRILNIFIVTIQRTD
ncbi:hypothetical protein KL86DYS2_12898 [uncultured Dysgonomonas sp.]|uniref:Uncharacterized protein n=1 Tax=uncultured Dysgonomonas sp. TaxID=206096 RepID=A0A212K2T0_9BACT|nr:hypothetical protein KL86DYS2_12898 [uncultured Dysgonomonas sp.]